MTTYAVGTARVTNASAVVTGTDTTWAVSAVAGGLFTMGGMAIPIRSVESDTSLTLEYAWPSTTRAGAYSILLLTAQAASAIEIYRRIQENVAALRNLSALGRVITAIETAEEMRKLLGLKTGQFLVDASGPFADRAQYDARPTGFSFLATDRSLLYLREGASGWSVGIQFGKGDKGDTGGTGPTGPESWATPVAWALGTAYRATAPRSVVTFGGATYVCIAAHTSSSTITPADAARWRLVAAKGETGEKGDNGGKGDKGDTFTVDAVGLFADRAQHDGAPEGFSFLATDRSEIYFRIAAGGWSIGAPFGKGDVGATGPESWSFPTVWQTNTIYRGSPPRSVVTFEGGSYVCLAAHTSSATITPADTTRWRLVSAKGDTGARGDNGSKGDTGATGPAGPGSEVGDYLTTLRNPGTGWLRRNGASYLKSAYPTLAALTPTLTFQEVAAVGGSNRDIDYSSSLKRLVRVAFSGAGISTSDDDGATWTNRTSPFSTSGTVHFVKWVAAASMWVAGGTGGQLATSPDGITWTLRTSNTTEDLYDAEGDASNLVVVGNAGIIIRATQTGVTWTVRATSVTANLRGIVKSGTTWLVVGTSICLTSTSTSAIGWTQRGSPGAALRVAAAPDGTIVAINATSVVRSTNLGVAWTASTMDVVGTGLYDVIYGPAGWVIAGNKYLATSVDGQAFVADKLIFTATTAWQFGLAVTDTAYVTCAIGATARAPIPANLNEFTVPNDAPSMGWIKAA